MTGEMILDGSDDEPEIGHGPLQQPFAAKSWIGRYLDRRGKRPCAKVDVKESSQKSNVTGWKPVTLHPVPLICVVIFTASLVAILSYLENMDKEQGGLAFVPQDQSFSTLTTFGYLYLPTIISVLFSMLWAWIDLDMKRLEPFFQMSQHQGAPADHSLLLQYPFDFIAWAPVKAAKQRHWGVFIGGMVTVLMFWAITPLQGAIFDTRAVGKSSAIAMQILSSLENVRRSKTDESLDMGVLEEAWNIAWLNATLPTFTTRNGTFLPFQLPSIGGSSDNSLITSNLTFLYTTLDCIETNVNFTTSVTLSVDNGKGCVVKTDYQPNRTLLYFGYYDNLQTDFSLQAFGCPEESSSNSFLAVVGDQPTQGETSEALHSDVIAQFCTTRYWQQELEASFQLPSLTVNHTRPISPPISLTPDRLNTTAFEKLISNGNIGVFDPKAMFNYSAAGVNSIGEWPRLYQYNFTGMYTETTTNMAGFILGILNTNSELYSSLLDSDKLTSVLEATHQLLFAVAASSMLSQSLVTQPEPAPGSALWTRTVLAVVIVQPFAFVMQALLVTTALCALFLASYYWPRRSALVADPDSLRNVGKLDIDIDPGCLDELVASGSRVHFALLRNGKRNHIQVHKKTAQIEEAELKHSVQSPQKAARPFYLGPTAGSVFIVILLLVLATLVALQRIASSRNGLGVHWSSPITQQLLLNYLPTLLATILEPGWTLLNRMLCLLQPFEELRRLNARARSSIDSRYSSLPPQLTIARALGNRHFLLVATCTVAMSASFLAVSMNALLYQTDTTVPVPMSFSRIKQPQFGNSSVLMTAVDQGLMTSIQFQDQFYLANMNLSQNAPMPAWTAQDHFLVPLSIPTSPNSGSATVYDVDSIGFGFEMDCKDLGSPSVSGPFRVLRQDSGIVFEDQRLYQTALNISIETGDDTQNLETCTTKFSLAGDFNSSSATAVLKAFDGGSVACGQVLFAMYAKHIDLASFGQQRNATLSRDLETIPRRSSADTASRMQGQPSQTFLACRNRLTASMYAATVSGSGMVLKSRPLDAPQLNIADYFSADANPDAFAAIVNRLNAAFSQLNEYEGDVSLLNQLPTSQQWFPYLLSLSANSNSTLDPTLPALSAAELIPSIQRINAQLGALVMSSQQDTLFTTPDLNATQVDAIRYDIVQRVFFDNVMFPITIALLIFNILVAIVFYLRAPPKLLPEMPTTIYAQMKLFAGSSVSPVPGSEAKTVRYGYGRFLGLDGRLRVGIEKAAYVQAVEQKTT